MKHMKIIITLFLAGCLILAGCSTATKESGKETKENDSTTSKNLHIITTFYPMYEFTKNIVKDKAQVDLLIPATVEPHDWEPTPKDVANIQKADLFVYNSPSMEIWVPSIKKTIDAKKPSFIQASKDIELMEGEEHSHDDEHSHNEESHAETHDHGGLDPHVWLSPVLAIKEVKTITEAVIADDPENKEMYEKNSQEYIDKLEQLDKEYRTTLGEISKKELITQHAAFGYLTREYGLKQIPIAGLSPEQEPSPAKLAELKKFAQQHDVKVIFFEALASPKVAKTLAGEIGAKTEVLHTLEGLSKKEQEQGVSYITLMRENLSILKKSLQN